MKAVLKSFEDMCNIDGDKIKEALAGFDPKDVVKACMGASPRVNQFAAKVFPEIDFAKVRETIGGVEISEVENMQYKMVNEINKLNI